MKSYSKQQETALFRYGIISSLLNVLLKRGDLTKKIKELFMIIEFRKVDKKRAVVNGAGKY